MNLVKRFSILFVLLGVLPILFVGLLSSCTSPGSDVVDAAAVDWLWGVENLRSGATRAWLRYDDIAGYCTSDPEIARELNDYIGEKVLLRFETKKWTDDESGYNSGCNNLPTGAESSTPIFRITSVELLGE